MRSSSRLLGLCVAFLVLFPLYTAHLHLGIVEVNITGIETMCNNRCSGHGICTSNGNGPKCQCNFGWGSESDITEVKSPSCAFRTCPSGNAWATPATSNATSVDYRFAHGLRECSNVGLCNRVTGECHCPAGYSGASCQRRSCPNACSGHGDCLSMRHLARLKNAFPLSPHYTINPGYPTAVPSKAPTGPTFLPTAVPTAIPTAIPTAVPTAIPTAIPTAVPTAIPTPVPTPLPSELPTPLPSLGVPSFTPTPVPTAVPTFTPTAIPTPIPTAIPTPVPTAVPTRIPTYTPTAIPTLTPTRAPTQERYGEFYGDGYNYTPGAPKPSWDADMIHGCMCHSSWAVGLNAGETQASEWFGPDCSLRRCPSADDPDTPLVDETDCEGILVPGTGGRGEIGNKCQVDCANRGVCNFRVGECSCFPGYHGRDCTLKSVLSLGTQAIRDIAALKNDDSTQFKAPRRVIPDNMGRKSSALDDTGQYFNDDL